MMLAYASCQPLKVMDDELTEKTALAWDDHRGIADAHIEYFKTELNKTDPSFCD
jgi:hypothetical protein